MVWFYEKRIDMRGAGSYDKIFFTLAMLLLVFGLFILASASLGISVSQFGYPYYYLLHQILVGVIPGLILLYAAYRVPYLMWRKYALLLLLAAFFLMFLVFVPGIWLYHGGARRWIALGFFSFQPAEFLKLAYVIYLATWLESKSKAISSFKFGFLPFLIMSAFIASFLILQPDIGTLGVLLVSILFMFFLSGGNFKQMALLSLIGLVIISILIITKPIRESKAICLKFPPLKKNMNKIDTKSTPRVPISGCKIKKEAMKALIIRNGKKPNLNEEMALDLDSSQVAR